MVKEIQILIDDNTGLHQLEKLKKLETLYQNKSSDLTINHISHANKKNEAISVVGTETFDNVELETYINDRRLAFLFQEDRSHLHDIDKSDIDFSLNYWKFYKNSIDERFHYLRDIVQIHESRTNKDVIDLMAIESDYQQVMTSDAYQKSQEIKAVLTLVNQYFAASKKELTRDQDNKLTLKPFDSDECISWHLLSRGEKTLIYLFFVVFLYQSKVEVFLFDEPEIALHPKWQQNLIKDLAELAPNSQFIIATHSPSLIQNGWLTHCLEIS